MNGANEVAVAAFLARKCAWLDIVRAIRHALERASFIASPNFWPTMPERTPKPVHWRRNF